MTEEELTYLLKVSYANNYALTDIDKKMRNNKEIIDDYNILLNMRDAKKVWTKTTINMVILSGLATGIAKLAFELSNKDLRLMLLSLSIGSIVLGYIKYKEEITKQNQVRDMLSKNDYINTINKYSINYLEDLKKEQKDLKEMKNKIIDREQELRQVFANNEKKLIKK